MADFSRILAAVDFSSASALALDNAARLARRLGAELMVVHVHQVPAAAFADGTGDGGDEAVVRRLERELEVFAREHGGAGIAFECGVSQGEPAFEIVRAAEDLKADLIVVGTHGRGGLAHMVMGSVAEDVIRRAGVPVLVVRAS